MPWAGPLRAGRRRRWCWRSTCGACCRPISACGDLRKPPTAPPRPAPSWSVPGRRRPPPDVYRLLDRLSDHVRNARDGAGVRHFGRLQPLRAARRQRPAHAQSGLGVHTGRGFRAGVSGSAASSSAARPRSPTYPCITCTPTSQPLAALASRVAELAAAEQSAAGRALARLARDAADRVQLLLAGRVDEAVAAARAAQLDIGVVGRRHAPHRRAARLNATLTEQHQTMLRAARAVESGTMRTRATVVLCADWRAATLLLSACAAAGGGERPVADASRHLSPSRRQSPCLPVSGLGPASSPTPDSQAAVAAVQQAAAVQVGASPADVHVEQVEAHEWGDSSLGCPRPGLLYSQVVTAGYLIVVTAGGKSSSTTRMLADAWCCARSVDRLHAVRLPAQSGSPRYGRGPRRAAATCARRPIGSASNGSIRSDATRPCGSAWASRPPSTAARAARRADFDPLGLDVALPLVPDLRFRLAHRRAAGRGPLLSGRPGRAVLAADRRQHGARDRAERS